MGISAQLDSASPRATSLCREQRESSNRESFVAELCCKAGAPWIPSEIWGKHSSPTGLVEAVRRCVRVSERGRPCWRARLEEERWSGEGQVISLCLWLL